MSMSVGVVKKVTVHVVSSSRITVSLWYFCRDRWYEEGILRGVGRSDGDG